MALQNIGASNKDDAFYRYKMPSMITKIEGRGNGIRTKIENIAHIAKALDRPASYITKYFGCELGAQSKLHEQHTSLVNGAHDTAKLTGLLDNFIKKYVQCYGCGNPETMIDISMDAAEQKGGKVMKVSLRCAACGFVSRVMDDKLTNFILKNAAEQKGGKGKRAMQRADNKCQNEGKAANENQKKLKKEKNNKGVHSKESTANKAAIGGSDEDHSTKPSCCQGGGCLHAADEDGDSDDVQWQADTSLEAVEQRMQEQLTTVTAELVTLSTDDSQKKKESSHNDAAVYVSSIHLDNSSDKQTVGDDANPYNELVEEIKANLGNAVTAAQLKKVMSSSSLPSQDLMNALFEALFDGVGKGFKEVVKNKHYLAAAVPDEGSQTLLLLAIEMFGSKCSALALKEIPFVLRALYYGDVLEEETILHWYNEAVANGRNSRVLQNAKQFVECLQNSGYESEEE